MVIGYKDRGKRGRVTEVDPKGGTVVVAGVNMAKRHTKANPSKNTKGGIIDPADAAQVRQGDGRVQPLRQAHAHRRAAHERGHQRARVQAVRRGHRDRGEGLMPIATALKDRYESNVKEDLRKQFSYGNVMQIPKIDKIILNIGMGESIGNAKAIDAASGTWPDHRPEADRHQGQALDRQVPLRRATRSGSRSRCAASGCGTSWSA